MTQQQAGQKVEELFKRFGSLINFLTLLVGAILSIMMVGAWRSNLESNDLKTAEWQLAHEAFHRDQASEAKEYRNLLATKTLEIDKNIREYERRVDSLDQRITSAEKSLNNVEKNAGDTNQALNKMSGDMQVVKEILTRIEKKQGG